MLCSVGVKNRPVFEYLCLESALRESCGSISSTQAVILLAVETSRCLVAPPTVKCCLDGDSHPQHSVPTQALIQAA